MQMHVFIFFIDKVFCKDCLFKSDFEKFDKVCKECMFTFEQSYFMQKRLSAMQSMPIIEQLNVPNVLLELMLEYSAGQLPPPNDEYFVLPTEKILTKYKSLLFEVKINFKKLSFAVLPTSMYKRKYYVCTDCIARGIAVTCGCVDKNYSYHSSARCPQSQKIYYTHPQDFMYSLAKDIFSRSDIVKHTNDDCKPICHGCTVNCYHYDHCYVCQDCKRLLSGYNENFTKLSSGCEQKSAKKHRLVRWPTREPSRCRMSHHICEQCTSLRRMQDKPLSCENCYISCDTVDNKNTNYIRDCEIDMQNDADDTSDEDYDMDADANDICYSYDEDELLHNDQQFADNILCD